MNKSERRRLDNEYLESIEWMYDDCVPEEDNKEITYIEVKNYLKSYLHNNLILAQLLPDLNSLTKKTIQALESENEEMFDLYFKKLCNFREMLQKYVED